MKFKTERFIKGKFYILGDIFYKDGDKKRGKTSSRQIKR